MNASPWHVVARRGPAAILMVVALVLASVDAALAGPDPTLGGPLFAQDQVLAFDWRSGAEPSTVIRTAIKDAAADATDSRGSQAAAFAWKAGGGNLVGYGLGATCGVNGLACFSRNAPAGFTLWFREQGHVFDWGTLKWCQAYASPPNGCYDAETIALDEFGHVEGLDHHVNRADDSDYEDAVVQTYSRTKPAAGWNAHRFGVCDVATLQRIYDVPTSATKLSTCLSLATSLGLTASPASVAYRGSTTLTATLKLADNAAYDRLRANPLSGRTVSLERRETGTTAWIPVGTMTAGASGTYTSSISLIVSMQFRAVFKGPADEGVGGATSAIASVTVGRCTVGPCPLSVPRGSTGDVVR